MADRSRKFDEDGNRLDSLVNTLCDIENNYADAYLPEDLKELFAEIQIKNEDFRNKNFFKNLEIIEEHLV
jgi:hypothetical protein